jgi:addiction module HigA family antidote
MRPNPLNKRKRRPTHPGELLREEILPHLDISQQRLADLLGVSRQTINELVTEKRATSLTQRSLITPNALSLTRHTSSCFRISRMDGTTVQKIARLWEEHHRKVASGEVPRFRRRQFRLTRIRLK